jgi:nicotinate phosphoribosyltransferase
VHLARTLGLVPIGTMAHEYLQAYQSFGVRLRDFQKAALEDWVQEYRGDLGVALTDVVGMDAFLADFDLYFAKLFDGLRHDSGDPIVWGEKALGHYQKLRIDAHTKRLVFSDGLDLPTAFAIHRHFADRTQLGFGIGTNLSNDVGLRPLNIVMKLTQCNGQPVAKLSDSPGKTLCKDETFLAYLRQVFNVKEEA